MLSFENSKGQCAGNCSPLGEEGREGGGNCLPLGEEGREGRGCVLSTFELYLHGVNPSNVYTTKSRLFCYPVYYSYSVTSGNKTQLRGLIRGLRDARYVLKN